MTARPPTLTIAPGKISGYLLDVDHVEGGSKTRWFFARGFRVDEPEVLAIHLAGMAFANWPGETIDAPPHGVKHRIVAPLACAASRGGVPPAQRSCGTARALRRGRIRRYCGEMTSTAWTPDLVGHRLVEAFRLLPGRPVMSSARGFTVDGVEVEPFGWPERFLPELRDRRNVMVWASCRAARESVAERVRDLGWPAATTERRRKVALETIAAGLNRQGRGEAAA